MGPYIYKIIGVVLLFILGIVPIFGANEIEPEVAYVIAQNLTAKVQSDGRSVLLSWQPPPKSGLIIIARSNKIIDLPEKLYVADSLGKYPSGTENGISTFLDANLADGEYYYSVVLVDQVRKRDVKLVPGHNFTVIPAAILRKTIQNEPVKETPVPEVKLPETKPEEKKDQIPSINVNVEPEKKVTDHDHQKFVTGLVVEKDNNAVRIYWNPVDNPENEKISYVVYRSTSPLSSLPLMHRAVKLAELEHPEVTFTDHELDRSGTYYYGVAVKQNDTESLPLKQDISYKRYFFIYSHEKQEIEKKLTDDTGVVPEKQAIIARTVTNIHYELTDTGVLLLWDPPVDKKGALIYTIYESAEPFNRSEESFLPAKSKILGRVFHPQTFFKIIDVYPDKDMFYAVTVRSEDQEENYKIVENEAYIRLIPTLLEKKQIPEKATEVETGGQEPEKEKVTTDETELVLLTAYRRGKYSETIYRLKKLQENETDKGLIGKMNFYIGLSYFHKKQYNVALKYMLKPETEFYDKERADFWTKRCLSQIARGKK